MSEIKREGNPLASERIGKLIAKFAIPAIISMLVSSLYNIVVQIFIGQGVGPLAISGLAVTFPLMNLMTAFGTLVGMGASTMLSVLLGQRNYNAACKVLGNVVSLNTIIGIVFMTVAIIFLDPILYFFGASEQTIPYARDYMVVILLGNVFSHMYFGMNAVLRAAGKPRQAMYATMFTVVMNTILDPVFIYLLDMGIRGAAFATILSQMMALTWQMKLFSDKDELLHLRRGIYRINAAIVRNIIAIGMSPFLMNVCACVVVIFINKGLLMYGGDLAVGAYGIANRVAFVFVMIVMGINQGMQPIAGYNYGARQTERLMRVLKLSMMAATVITTSGFLVAEFVPELCVSLFTSDPELTGMAARGMRIIMCTFPIIGFQMVATNFFQSIGKAGVSIFLSLSRQMLFLLPMLIVLPLRFGIDGVWASMPVADTISSLVTLGIMLRYTRRMSDLKNQ